MKSTPAINRRDWLQLGALGWLGASLPGLAGAESARQRAPRARSCVLFLLHGGPSQLDIWDMKPAAPAEVRGVFRPIATNVPGIRITEHLPRLAKMAQRFTIIRSMTHTALFHNAATYFVTTGQPPLRDILAVTPTENDFPHLGSQVALKQSTARNVPAAVSLPDSVSDGPYTTPGQNGGFLGAQYAPFRIIGDPNSERFTVDGLAGGDEAQGMALAGRRSLLGVLDEQNRWLAHDRAVDQLDRHQQRAMALLT